MIKNVRQVIEIIEADGWYLFRHRASSHRQFKHPTKPGKVTINGKLSDDVDKKLENWIFKQARLK
jgi:predicted RNA binding protein YcfA (HicA-like mRNA interferase family)